MATYTDDGRVIIKDKDGNKHIVDPLTKDKNVSLSSDVATALGLTGNPQVNGALDAINDNFIDTRKYWWGKYNAAYSESLGTAATVTIAKSATMADYSGKVKYTVSFDSSGNVVATSNGTITLAYSGGTDVNGLYLKDADGANVYKCSGSASAGTWSAALNCHIWTASAQLVSSVQNIRGSFIENVNSYTSNAYPTGGVQDGYYYSALGRAPLIGAKIATGSYTGTGTYGSGSKNSLTLDFTPKKISIINSTGIVFGELIINGSTVYGYSYSGSFVALTGSISGNTISWYAADAAKQLNASGVAYLFVAEG